MATEETDPKNADGDPDAETNTDPDPLSPPLELVAMPLTLACGRPDVTPRWLTRVRLRTLPDRDRR